MLPAQVKYNFFVFTNAHILTGEKLQNKNVYVLFFF